MTSPAFGRLVDELLAHGGDQAESAVLPDGSSLATLTLEVDGVKVLLCETVPSARGTGAVLCADCGEIPASLQADVMEQALAMNLLLYRDCGATLCLDAISRRLLLLANISPETADAADVLAMARQFAKGVREFEANHFCAGSDDRAGSEILARRRA